MWVKNSSQQDSGMSLKAASQDRIAMPWMAANPSNSSSSFGDCPAPQGAGISFTAGFLAGGWGQAIQ